MNTLSIFIIACALSSTMHASEYKTRSYFDKSYKCTSDVVGGYLHNNSGASKLVNFKGEDIFFITHITDLPIQSIQELPFLKDIKGEGAIRDRFENSVNVSIDNYDGYVNEKGTYMLRRPNQDPKKSTYVISNKCSSGLIVDKYEGNISCPGDSYLFKLDVSELRFSYAYLGTWHDPREENQNPDSSSFSFGKCVEYYP